jgi:hypothetical protein
MVSELENDLKIPSEESSNPLAVFCEVNVEEITIGEKS